MSRIGTCIQLVTKSAGTKIIRLYLIPITSGRLSAGRVNEIGIRPARSSAGVALRLSTAVTTRIRILVRRWLAARRVVGVRPAGLRSASLGPTELGSDRRRKLLVSRSVGRSGRPFGLKPGGSWISGGRRMAYASWNQRRPYVLRHRRSRFLLGKGGS